MEMAQVDSKDLDTLCEFAKELGTTRAVPFDAGKVVVDPRVRLKCRLGCDDYGTNFMCPPHVMGVREFRDVLAKYSRAILIQMDAPITKELEEEIKRAADVASLYRSGRFLAAYAESFTPTISKLRSILYKLESEAFSLGYRFAIGLATGPCRLCEECIAAKSNLPCSHPFRARPAMEAMGIDVFETAKNAGLPFSLPPRGKAIWNGLLLVG